MARNSACDGDDAVGDVRMILNSILQTFSGSTCEDLEPQAPRDLSTTGGGGFSSGSLTLKSPTLTLEQIKDPSLVNVSVSSIWVHFHSDLRER